jgi:hypothetical protein
VTIHESDQIHKKNGGTEHPTPYIKQPVSTGSYTPHPHHKTTEIALPCPTNTQHEGRKDIQSTDHGHMLNTFHPPAHPSVELGRKEKEKRVYSTRIG